MCNVYSLTKARRDPYTERPSDRAALHRALVEAGVIFLDDGAEVAGGPGVRLRKDQG